MYNISLPELSCHEIDVLSTVTLQERCPFLLIEYKPLDVLGDGNCMYRAVSLGLFDSQDHNLQLCLMTALEVILHREVYDQSDIIYCFSLRCQFLRKSEKKTCFIY
jgi:hypothetical protein